MTALDQAFIRAYSQPADGPALATLPAETIGDPLIARQPPPLRPALEVDEFPWPRLCTRLCAAVPEQLERLAQTLLAAAARGQKTVAVGSCGPGEGATTTTLCVSRLLSQRGARVVVVDATLSDPQIARRFGLAPEAGWEEVFAGRQSLDDVLIESTDGSMAVLPVLEPLTGVAGPRDEDTIAENIAALAAAYDLVLIDWGALDRYLPDRLATRGIGRHVALLVLVHNAGATSEERRQEVERAVAAAGIPLACILQNFHRA